MEQGMNLDLAFLIISAEGAVITFLMGAFGYLYVADRKNTHRRLDDQDGMIDKFMKVIEDQQKQINTMHNEIKNTVDLIKTNQEHDGKRLEFMQELILGKMMAAK